MTIATWLAAIDRAHAAHAITAEQRKLLLNSVPYAMGAEAWIAHQSAQEPRRGVSRLGDFLSGVLFLVWQGPSHSFLVWAESLSVIGCPGAYSAGVAVFI